MCDSIRRRSVFVQYHKAVQQLLYMSIIRFDAQAAVSTARSAIRATMRRSWQSTARRRIPQPAAASRSPSSSTAMRPSRTTRVPWQRLPPRATAATMRSGGVRPCTRLAPRPMPGAAEFLREVARRGVAIFYVSNRWSEVNYEPTIENLKALGFPSVDAEHVLLMEDRKMSDKQPRFDRITEDYDVVVYMGDNAGDLPLGTKGMNRAARNAAIDAAQEEFGTQYIVFPNPAYGSWVSALSKDYMTMSPEAREAFYEKMLTE